MPKKNDTCSKFLEHINSGLRGYYQILSPGGVPDWLEEYIETPEMLFQEGVGTNCGMCYTKLSHGRRFYSSLAHSVGVALIVWHFTHDKKQTLAGLFHDIASPSFKHVVDLMDGDSSEESTESRTTEIIAGSPEIMRLLTRDGLTVADVDNYHLYPIADNDQPRLAADRLEYTFSNAIFVYRLGYDADGRLSTDDQSTLARRIWLDWARKEYRDLKIEQNEDGLPELGFQHEYFAREFVRISSWLSWVYRCEVQQYSAEFIIAVLKGLFSDGLLCREDLWRKSEADIIEVISHSRFAVAFDRWQRAQRAVITNLPPGPELEADVRARLAVVLGEDLPAQLLDTISRRHFYVHDVPAKKRYIDPLVQGQRISTFDPASAEMIRKNLARESHGYIWLENEMPEVDELMPDASTKSTS